MTERGHYRAIHAVLVDSPEFQELSPEAMAVFLQIKLRLGASGIGVLYESAIREAMPKASDRVAAAFTELQDSRWIQREGAVVWLRNGLRYDPHMSLDHAKHRSGVEAHLRALPKLKIVNDFAAYYGLDVPFPPVSPKKGTAKSIDSLSEGSAVATPKREKGKGVGSREEVSAVEVRRIATTLPSGQSACEGGGSKEPEAPLGLLRDACLRGADAAVIEGQEIGLGLLVNDYRRLLRLGFVDVELRNALSVCRMLPPGHEDRAPDGPFTLTWLAARIDGDLERRDGSRVFRLQDEFRKRSEPPAPRSLDGPTPIGAVVDRLVGQVSA